MKKILLLLCAAAALGQEAIVVDLSPEDSANIASLYRQDAEIEARISKAREEIGKKYATWGPTNIVNMSGERIPPPFNFSKDFRHIVPPQDPQKSCVSAGTNCWTVNPAGGGIAW